MEPMQNIILYNGFFVETACSLADAESAIAQAQISGSLSVTFSELQPDGSEVVKAKVHRILGSCTTLAEHRVSAMDRPKRPDSWSSAMSFLEVPEDAEIAAYVEALETYATELERSVLRSTGIRRSEVTVRATPRTDAVEKCVTEDGVDLDVVPADFARQLERDLKRAADEVSDLRAFIEAVKEPVRDAALLYGITIKGVA